MSLDDGGCGAYSDLTPGDFHVSQPTEVDTTSLGGFGRTYELDTRSFFGANMQLPLGMMLGESRIGNSTAFHELGGVNHLSTLGAEYAERNATDLVYGNLALGNAAMYMAEGYASTDSFNGAITASVVGDVFQPSGESGPTLMQQRLQQEQAEAEAREQAEAQAAGPGGVAGGVMPPAPVTAGLTGQPSGGVTGTATGSDPAETSPLAEFAAVDMEENDFETDREVAAPELVDPATPAAPGPDGVVSDVGDWAEENLTLDPRRMRP